MQRPNWGPNDWNTGAPLTLTKYRDRNGKPYKVAYKCHIGRVIESEMTWENTGIGIWWWIWYTGDECPVKIKGTVEIDGSEKQVMEINFWRRYKRGCIKLK